MGPRPQLCPAGAVALARAGAFTALRYFALDGTDHSSHHEQASMIRRYLTWRNRHATDPALRKGGPASRRDQEGKGCLTRY